MHFFLLFSINRESIKCIKHQNKDLNNLPNRNVRDFYYLKILNNNV